MDRGLGFRRDVEGLRAIAILLVVAAHAHVPGLAGGFVGVDVFFVLSGFLITGLLSAELQRAGRIDFVGFYARRFRRLMPAMLVMVGCTAIAAAPILLDAEAADLAKSAAAASIWASNILFAFAEVDYFAPEAEANLMLHTWSLGVEEQFYLAWPLLLLVAVRAGRTRGAMLTVLITSLAACLWLSWTSPQAAFYLMPTRAWQFAAGALVALYGARAPARAGWLGLVMIVGAGVALTPAMVYPGALALIPSAGAALVLAAGNRDQAAGAGALLSTPPMQYVGRVSYSWYLWHWPVLLLGDRVFSSVEVMPRRAVLILASFALAVASYRLVEAPIRRSDWVAARPRVVLAGAAALMVAAVGLTLGWQQQAQARLDGDAAAKALMARLDPPAIYKMGCDGFDKTAEVKLCSFGDPNAEKVAVLMGDSIGAQWSPAAAEVFTRAGWRYVVVTKSACPMVDAPFFYARIGRRYTVCEQWREAALAKVAALKPEVVILGSTHGYDFTHEQWVGGTRSVLAKVSPSARRIVVLKSTPSVTFDAAKCVFSGSNDGCESPLSDGDAGQVFAYLNEAAAGFPNVRTVNMDSTVCPSGRCSAYRGDVIVYRDNHHLTVEFVKSVAPAFSKGVGL